jgi:hypothetical protein
VSLYFSPTANPPRYHNAPSSALTISRLAFQMQMRGRKPCAKTLRRQAAGNGPMRVLANQVALHLEQNDDSILNLPPVLKKRRTLPPPKPHRPPQQGLSVDPRVATHEPHGSTVQTIHQLQDDQEAFYPDAFDNPSTPSSETPLRTLGPSVDHDATPDEDDGPINKPSNTNEPWFSSAMDDGAHLPSEGYRPAIDQSQEVELWNEGMESEESDKEDSDDSGDESEGELRLARLPSLDETIAAEWAKESK